MRFLLRRLGFYLLAGWVSLTLNFLIPRLAPGDPASALQARFQGRLDAAALAAMKEVFGYTDAPLIQQYFSYVKNLLHGEFGISVAYFPAPVTEVIGSALLWTLFLAGTSVVVSFALGSLLGILSAWKRGGLLDSIAPPAFIFLGAFPYFWMAMLLLFSLGFLGGWFPVRHAYSDHLTIGWNTEFLLSAVHHAFLPATSIVIASLGGWLLGMRNTMIGILAEDYITMAQAKGLSPLRVMLHYAARNALLPNITGFGMALGFVLSGSLLTEIVFSYPGQGYLLYQAVKSQDFPLMQGLFLSITTAVLAANWLVDIAYVFLDPEDSAMSFFLDLAKNKKASLGLAILGAFVLVALFGPLLVRDAADFLGDPLLPPSAQFWLGTTRQGQDVFAQTIVGARTSLVLGFVVGLIVTLIGATIGIAAGFLGGWVDDLLSLLTNVFLIMPGLPLAVVLAAYLEAGPVSMAFVLILTGWAWNARVIRAQTLSLAQKDFIAAAVVGGESRLRIMFFELFPNMTSIIVSGFIGATVYAIGAQVGLEFLGLGDVSTVTWGTNLYWASNNQDLLTESWWTIVPTGVCVALVGFSLVLINFAIDEITNPKLRAESGFLKVLAQMGAKPGFSTPVVRRAEESA